MKPTLFVLAAGMGSRYGGLKKLVSSILCKLNLRDRNQLAIWAVQSGQTTKDLCYE